MNYIELEACEFKTQLENDTNSILIDVREEYEFEDINIGGINIPMGEVLAQINDIKENASIYLCCKSGNRSRAIAYHLAPQVSPSKVYSLIGGIPAYLESND